MISSDITDVVVVLSNDDIQTLNIQAFLDNLSFKKLPVGPSLEKLCGRVKITIHYEGRQEYLILDNQVRAYFQKLIQEWPEWLFFLDFEFQHQLELVLCALPNFHLLQTDEPAEIGGLVDPDELFELIRPAGKMLFNLAVRADMTFKEVHQRYAAVLEVFQKHGS